MQAGSIPMLYYSEPSNTQEVTDNEENEDQEKLNEVCCEMREKFRLEESEILTKEGAPPRNFTDKDVKLFEWKESAKDPMSLIGQGLFCIKEHGKDLLLVFVSNDKTISYWAKDGSKFKRANGRKDMIMFCCHEDFEGRSAAKIIIAIFSKPDVAEYLSMVFDKNCEKAVQN